VAQHSNSVPDRLLDQTIRHTHARTHAPGGTPLNEWSARRRSLYLHNAQQNQ